jgi:hypothetical protein
MRAFIIRPFGERNGLNFDTVEAKLIQPALTACGIHGGTTGAFKDSGSIHEDMFLEIADADIVIADISLHNANVFYELGVRHAIRKRTTVLIRTRVEGNDTPFDIQGIRYVSYVASNPEQCIAELQAAITQSLAREASDSPVWNNLPNITANITDPLQTVPTKFDAAIKLFAKTQSTGALRLTLEDVRGARWERAAFKSLSEKMANAQDFRGAASAYKRLVNIEGSSYSTCKALGNVYNRLGKLDLSDATLDEANSIPGLTPSQLSELNAQRGRNAKTKWIAELRTHPPGSVEQARSSLESATLVQAISGYRFGAMKDLNSFYSWWNYLALLLIIEHQETICPEAFSATQIFGDRYNINLADEIARAKHVIATSIRAVEDLQSTDQWLIWTKADFLLLCKNDLQTIRRAYLAANTQQANSDFVIEAARRQLEIFPDLGMLDAEVATALTVIRKPRPRGRAILFSGLMINKPGRFEAHQEASAKANIKAALSELLQNHGNTLFGLAGGACGGDILFHEACAELGIESRLYLCLPKSKFEKTSVESGGRQWVERLTTIYNRVLSASQTNPYALQTLEPEDRLPDYVVDQNTSFWVRANRWLTHSAMAQSHSRPRILLLTDGQVGTPGGTYDFFGLADEFDLAEPIVVAP